MKRIPKQVFLLGLVSLFTDIASEMLYPITPIFLTTVLHTSMAAVGIIEGIAEVTAGILKGYFGIYSDRIGKRSIFVRIGYSVSGIVKPLPGLIPSFASVLFSRTADRIGKGIRTAPRDALLAGHSEGNTGAVFGFHRGMDTLGAALGPLAALLLLEICPGNYELVFLAAFIPSVIAVAFTFVVKDKPGSIKNSIRQSYLEFWKTAPGEYKSIVIIVTCFSFVNSSDVFLILKSKAVSGSDSLAVLGYVFYNLVYAAVSYPAGLLADKFGKKLVFAFGLILFSAVYFGFGLSQNPALIWVLFALYGFYAAFTEGVSKAWVSDIIKDRSRGSAIGILTMLTSLAVMLGSVLTGILWDAFGASVPFLISGIISLLLAAIVLRKIL